MLDLTLTRWRGPGIAPMTLVEPASFDDTVGRLRTAGHEVGHVALLAARATVLRRLASGSSGTSCAGC